MEKHKTTSPPIPTQTLNEITNTQNRLNKWIVMIRTMGVSQGIDIRDKCIITEQMYLDLQNTININQVKYDANVKLATTMEKQVDATEKTFKNILEQKPMQPKYSSNVIRNKEYKIFTQLGNEHNKMQALIKEWGDESKIIKMKAIVEYYPMLSAQLSTIRENMIEQKRMIDSCENHAFNPKCKACMCHPWKIEKDAQQVKYNDMIVKCNSIKADMTAKFGSDVSDVYDEAMFSMAKKQLANIEHTTEIATKYNALDVFWKEQVLVENGFKKWTINKTEQEATLKELKCAFSKLRSEIENMQSQLSKDTLRLSSISQDVNKMKAIGVEWTDEYADMQNDIDSNKLALSKWTLWKDKHTSLSDDLKLWGDIDSRGTEDEHIKNIKMRKDTLKWDTDYQSLKCDIQKQKQVIQELEQNIETTSKNIDSKRLLIEQINSAIDQANIYIAKFDTTNVVKHRIIDTLKKIDEWKKWEQDMLIGEATIKARDLHDSIVDIERTIDNCKLRTDLECKRNDLLAAIKVSHTYDEIGQLEDFVDDYKTDKHRTIARMEHLDAMIKQDEKTKLDIENLRQTHERMTTMSATLGAILSQFSTFKDWVLEKRILPVIIRQCNTLISVMSRNHRQIELKCAFDSTMVNKSFAWAIKDGGQSPPIEKASGFQKFIISLAMRIVLGRLGVAGIRNSQLFIDEGFTACDHDNLINVPVVLDELLEIYAGGIVLVSHLNDLRDNIRHKVMINRDEQLGISQLQFGSIQTGLTTVKKVGKPRLVRLC